MTAYQKLIGQFQRNVSLKKAQDGFESSTLRHSIIDVVSQLDLPAEPPAEIYSKLKPEDKIRIGYLSQCCQAGANACVELLRQNFAFKEKCCYHEYALAGAAEIGSEIGLEYGRALYPELQKMRDQGIKHKKLVAEPEKSAGSYGFSVFIYKDYYDLEDIQFQPVLPQTELTYDMTNERYIEFHSFPDRDQADAAHRKWQNYIQGKASTPPVKYGFEIISDPIEGTKIYPVMSVDISVQESSRPDREFRVFATFNEAIEQNRIANNNPLRKASKSHSKQKDKKHRSKPHQPSKPPVGRVKSEHPPKKKSNAKSFGISGK